MTLFVTVLHLALWLAGMWHSRVPRLMFILGMAMFASWIAGGWFSGIERAVLMVMIDLAVVLVISSICTGFKAWLVAGISLALIGLRSAYMGVPYINHHSYAIIVNSAFALQLLIGGGFANVIGRRVDDWLVRVWPGGARALHNVAHR